jgi:hypothetical protein
LHAVLFSVHIILSILLVATTFLIGYTLQPIFLDSPDADPNEGNCSVQNLTALAAIDFAIFPCVLSTSWVLVGQDELVKIDGAM